VDISVDQDVIKPRMQMSRQFYGKVVLVTLIHDIEIDSRGKSMRCLVELALVMSQ